MPTIGEEIPFTIGEAAVSQNPGRGFSYYAYDFLSGTFLGELPLRTVSFGRILNGSGQLTASLDLRDARVRATQPVALTTPNKTLIVVDYQGQPMWCGISLPRKWDVDSSSSGTTGILGVSYTELWAYFAQRIQATDYSGPPYSGLHPLGGSGMPLWTKTPCWTPLIAAEVVKDALLYSDSQTMQFGNPCGGMAVTINGQTPAPALAEGVAPGDLVAQGYPYPSLQSVESIVSSLSGLGLGPGFDHGMEFAYENGQPMGKLNATWDIQWPWRGYEAPGEDADDVGDTQNYIDSLGASADADDAKWAIDLTQARKYSFPEDGTQTADQIYEIGGGGAISVHVNVAPLEQGYPLVERVVSRSSIQSTQIMELLNLLGTSDLSIYSYAPVTPSVTIAIDSLSPIFAEYGTGSLARIIIPKGEVDGEPFDPRFPGGMDQVWRMTSYQMTVADEGEILAALTFAPPVQFLEEVNKGFI